MRLRGLIPVLLLLAACERSAPAPEATGDGSRSPNSSGG